MHSGKRAIDGDRRMSLVYASMVIYTGRVMSDNTQHRLNWLSHPIS